MAARREPLPHRLLLLVHQAGPLGSDGSHRRPTVTSTQQLQGQQDLRGGGEVGGSSGGPSNRSGWFGGTAGPAGPAGPAGRGLQNHFHFIRPNHHLTL